MTAVYSGSFNPLHIGHLAILQHLVEEFDRVLLVVSPKNPLKSSASADDSILRLEAARAALARHPELCAGAMAGATSGATAVAKDVATTGATYGATVGAKDVATTGFTEVSDIEFGLPLPNYTINTLDALQAAEPLEHFTLVMGGDQIADIRRWKDYRRILSEYGVAVFPREGFDLKEIKKDLLEEDPHYSIRLMEMPLVTVSSTMIRQAILKGEDVSALLM